MVILMNHPAPTEGVQHVEPNVTAYCQEKSLGKGTLYIAENVFCWISSSGEGFSLEYPSIFIHAVCKDLSHFPYECLYLMVDRNISIGEEEPSNEISSALNNLSVDEEDATIDDDEEVDATVDDDEDPPLEMRFVPDNNDMLDVMFRAVSDCQALNPDPNDKSDEDDESFPAPTFSIHEGNGFVDFGEEEEEGEEEEPMNEDQFEDAEQ